MLTTSGLREYALKIVKQRVLIVGYGEMGHAMQHLLQHRHAITVWRCDTAEGMAVPLTQAATDKDVIILCVPTGPLHDIVAELKTALHEDTLVISLSKGLDDKGRIAFDAVSAALEASSPRVLIYGPMISEELCADRPGFAQLGSPDPEWARRTLSLFADSGLYLTTTAETAPCGLAGLGDLLTTATSVDSHHHALGVQLARGERDNLAGEGTHTIGLIVKLNLIDTSQYPLMHLIQEIVLTDSDAREKWRSYLDGTFRA